MNNETLNRIARELASPRFYIEEKYMMLLRSVPMEVLEHWCHIYFEDRVSIYIDSDTETDDDLDERDANGSVLPTPFVDVNSIYPN